MARNLAGGGRLVSIAVLDAYIDESNTHNGAPIVCSAGYIFTPKGSEQFRQAWVPFLRERGLECFHAADHQYRNDADELFMSIATTTKDNSEGGGWVAFIGGRR
jgi:hypothetical protein